MSEKHMVAGKMFLVVKHYGDKQPVIYTDGTVMDIDLPTMPKADNA